MKVLSETLTPVDRVLGLMVITAGSGIVVFSVAMAIQGKSVSFVLFALLFFFLLVRLFRRQANLYYDQENLFIHFRAGQKVIKLKEVVSVGVFLSHGRLVYLHGSEPKTIMFQARMFPLFPAVSMASALADFRLAVKRAKSVQSQS